MWLTADKWLISSATRDVLHLKGFAHIDERMIPSHQCLYSLSVKIRSHKLRRGDELPAYCLSNKGHKASKHLLPSFSDRESEAKSDALPSPAPYPIIRRCPWMSALSECSLHNAPVALKSASSCFLFSTLAHVKLCKLKKQNFTKDLSRAPPPPNKKSSPSSFKAAASINQFSPTREGCV